MASTDYWHVAGRLEEKVAWVTEESESHLVGTGQQRAEVEEEVVEKEGARRQQGQQQRKRW